MAFGKRIPAQAPARKPAPVAVAREEIPAHIVAAWTGDVSPAERAAAARGFKG
jgi:hypothetical protein